MRRLAVLFPGIGYTADRPLLHYSRRLAESFGYETRVLPYGGFPKKVRGDRDKLQEVCALALSQARQFLADTDFSACDDILFIGKSIGTLVAAAIAAESSAGGRIRFVLYTPLEETFSYPLGDALVFTGSGDPGVGGAESRIPALCAQRQIRCFVIDGANHSLETADPLADIRNLQDVMRHTSDFLREEQLRRIAHFEALLQALQELVAKPEASAAELSAAREAVGALGQYYGSADWKLDLAADEAGQLPKELRRGVLSEDGIFNALENYRERMADLNLL